MSHVPYFGSFLHTLSLGSSRHKIACDSEAARLFGEGCLKETSGRRIMMLTVAGVQIVLFNFCESCLCGD